MRALARRALVIWSASMALVAVGCGLIAELDTHAASVGDASVPGTETSPSSSPSDAGDGGGSRDDATGATDASCTTTPWCTTIGPFDGGRMCEDFESLGGGFAPWLEEIDRPEVDSIALVPVPACATAMTNIVRMVSSVADAGPPFGVNLERRLQTGVPLVTSDVDLSFMLRIPEAGGPLDRGWSLASLTLGRFGTEPETSWYQYELHMTPVRMSFVQVAPDPAAPGARLRAERALVDPVTGQPWPAPLATWFRVRLHVHTQAPTRITVRIDDATAPYFEGSIVGSSVPPPKPLILLLGQWHADPPAGKLILDYDQVLLDWN